MKCVDFIELRFAVRISAHSSSNLYYLGYFYAGWKWFAHLENSLFNKELMFNLFDFFIVYYSRRGEICKEEYLQSNWKSECKEKNRS